MASITGSATTSASAYNQMVAKNNGIGGLASGLDTDSIIESLLIGHRSKIAAQGQQKTLLQWKMTAYRSVATAMRSFQNKYVGTASSPTYLGNYSFWNTYKASSSNDSVTNVSAGSTASTGSFNITSVNQLASAMTITSKQLTRELISDEFDLDGDFSDKTLQLTYNGTTRTIKLDSLNDVVTTGTPNSAITNFENELQKLVDKAFGTGVVNVSLESASAVGGVATDIDDCQITFSAGSGQLIVSNTVEELGLEYNMGNRVPTGSTIRETLKDHGLVGDTFKISVNGVEFSFTGDTQMSEVSRRINQSTAGVKMEWNSVKEQWTFTANTAGAGDAIVMEDVEGNFLNTLVGARSGTSVSSSAVYSDASQTATTNMSDWLESILQTINSSWTISDFDSVNLTDSPPSVSYDDLMKVFKHLSGTSFTMTVGDQTETMTLSFDYAKLLSGVTGSETLEEAVTEYLNYQIESHFGKDVAAVVRFEVDSSGDFHFVAETRDYSIAFGEATKTNEDFFAGLGINAKANQLVSGYSVTVSGANDCNLNTIFPSYNTTPPQDTYSYGMEININGKTFYIKTDLTFNDLVPEFSDSSFYPGHTITTYEELLDAMDYVSTTGAYPNEDEYKRLDTLKKQIDKQIDANRQTVLEEKLNEALQDSVKVTGTSLDKENAQKLRFSVDGDGNVSLTSSDKSVVFALKSDTQSGTYLDLFVDLELGASGGTLTNANSAVLIEDIYGFSNSDTGTFEITVGNTTKYITWSGSDSMQDLINRVNIAFDKEIATLEDGQIKFAAGTKDLKFNESGTGSDGSTALSGNILETLFGVKKYGTTADSYGTNRTYGTNASIIIDDEEIISTSNTFTYKGVTFEVSKIFNAKWELDSSGNKVPGSSYDSNDFITITVGSDPDVVIDKIKEFIEDYNAMIDIVYTLLREEKSSGYAPLTDEQKAEMSQTEIENWEAEAKKGLLRNDSTLTTILNQLRSTMYTKTESVDIGIWDIGITTMSLTSGSGMNYSNSGKLELTEDGEKQLRSMLLNNPDMVRELFNSNDGLTARINKVLVDAVNESTGAQGSLVRMAGTDKVTGDNESYLSKRITTIDEYIAKLTTRMENEYNRLWSKFAAMESAISKYNTQMSYIDSMYNY